MIITFTSNFIPHRSFLLRCSGDYLKDKKFKCFTAATEEAIEALWEQLQKFGPPLGNDMKQPSLKKELKDRY